MGQIQKIYSTSQYVCITIRFPGKTKFYYFGRGSGYEGLWEGVKIPPPEMRCVDKFVEYLRKYLSGSRFQEFILNESDRILLVPYIKTDKENFLILFWSGRLLYFANYYWDFEREEYKLFLSWDGYRSFNGEGLSRQQVINGLMNYFISVGMREKCFETIDGVEQKLETIDLLLKEERKKFVVKQINSRKKNSLKRKIVKIEQDLSRVAKWEEMQNVLIKDQLDLSSDREVNLFGWKFKFASADNHYKRRGIIFDKIKSLKSAQQLLDNRLGESKRKLKQFKEGGSNNLDAHKVKVLAPVWKIETRQNRKTNPAIGADSIKIINIEVSGERLQLGVGLNAQGNDQLRNKWASKDDYWFHLDELKSSHLVLKLDGRPLDQKIIDISSSILAHYSGFKDEWIPVIYTKVKNLRSIKGSSGKVSYKKEKHLRIRFIEEWTELVC